MELGLLVKERPSVPAPAKRIQTVRVAGRDGDLIIDEGLYDSIVIPIKFNFMAKRPDEWMETFREAKRWLQGHGNLYFSDDIDWFFIARYVQITDTERTSRRLGNFTAEFTCDPYMYHRSGQASIDLESGGELYNPWSLSHPAYFINGIGEGTLTVNGNEVQFISSSPSPIASGYLRIDTNLMRTSGYAGNPANKAISGNYEDLYLNPGRNTVSISSGFTVSVTPNWRTI